ncbi:MAG: 4-aminobutyrate aminotransferase apoenzyme, partial [Candidatus Angelobacter sp.]|nr:4-aminobutyrate aminotransferase apoenzyme [Candidatus Angelobacter sp.]
YVIAFYNSFHGRTMGALSLTASKLQQKRRFMPITPGVTHVPYPHTFRRPEGTDAKQYAIDCARFIEDKVLKTILPPEEVAAIFLEPIQGEGGYVPAPTEFLQEIRSICDRHGILLVADEVQSGCGRTGKMWAIQHSGVEPDIITSAKGIASGMPLGVMMSKAHVMDWVPGSHASTFGGNPVCIAAAMATLDVLERSAIKNAEVVGKYMLDRMNGWGKKYEIVGEVRGRGLMIGVEIVKDKKSKALAGKERDRIVDQLTFERGVLFLGCGETTIRISPPLIITKEQADIAMDVLEESIGIVNKEVSAASGPGKQMGA